MKTYTLDDLERDGTGYVLETAEGRLSGKSAVALVRFANECQRGRQRPVFFLEAWKEAVQLAGEQHVHVQAEAVDAATDKDQLRPDIDAIAESIGVLSDGERRFLLAIFQFFNDQALYDFCEERELTVPSLADLALLDDKHRQVITRLLHSYSGW